MGDPLRAHGEPSMKRVLHAIACAVMWFSPAGAALADAGSPSPDPAGPPAEPTAATPASACAAHGCPTQGRFPGFGRASGGAASYEIPLSIPRSDPALNVLVSLVYSSRLGNGELGMGWSVAGGPGSVYRCPAFVELDGFQSRVHFSDSDFVCAGGERLMLVSGVYGKDGSRYVTEMDTGRIYELHGDLNDADSRFIARKGDGYAFTYEVRGLPGGAQAPLYWQQTSTDAPGGQSVRYQYETTGAGQTVLSEIDYPGSDIDAGKQPLADFVRFEHAPREDVESSFLAGGESRQTLVLTHIIAGTKAADGSDRNIQDYVLEYRRSRSTGRMLLARLRGCAASDEGPACLRPIDVEWLDQDIAYAAPERVDAGMPQASIAGRWVPGEPLPPLARYEVADDYDGDGRHDLLVRGSDGRTSVLFFDGNRRPVHTSAIPASLKLRDERASDLLGHDLRHVGGSDLVGDSAGRFGASGWRRGRFQPPEPTAIAYSADAIVLDADGDGQPDLLVGKRVQGAYEVRLYRNRGSTDRRLVFAHAETVASVPDARGLHLEIGEMLESTQRTALLRSDRRLEGAIDFASTNAKSLITSVLAPSAMGIADEAQDAGFVFADVNGDGLKDLVYASGGTLRVQINTDGHFAAPQDTGFADPRSTPVARSGTLIADVNSDGKDELLFPARRLVDYCITQGPSDALCSDAIDAIEPRMDLGIYAYDVIAFAMDAQAHVHPELRSGLHPVGQANRASVGGLHGDGYPELVSPFDRGIANGAFRTAAGTFEECPEHFGCGLRIAMQEHARSPDARDTELDLVKRVRRDDGLAHDWTYFPLSSEAHLYAVPLPGSRARYIDRDRTFFASSMYVVGEDSEQQSDWKRVLRFRYGGGAYDTHGRGFDGFRWIAGTDETAGTQGVLWFRQAFPYRGTLERIWTRSARDPDDDNSFLAGKPGKRFVAFDRIAMRCHGPPLSPVSRAFHCLPSSLPTFRVDAGSIPSEPSPAHRMHVDAIGIPNDAQFADHAAFRARFPSPANASRLEAAWKKANATLIRHSGRGGRAEVESENNGWKHHGEDRFRYGAQLALQETRDYYEAVSVGPEYCTRSDGQTVWSCGNDGSTVYGLPDIVRPALVSGAIARVPCAQGHCARIALLLTKVLDPKNSGKAWPTYSMAPLSEGSRFELLVTLPDYTPVSLKQIDYLSRTRSDSATFTYHLDTPAVTIALPTTGRVQ